MSRGISVGPTGTTDEGDSRAGCCRGRVKAPLAIHTQYRYKVVCSPPRRGCGGRWRPSGMEQQPLSALAIAALATPAPSDNPPKPPPIRHAATPCTPQPPTAEASHAALPKPCRPRCSRHRWPGTASLSPAAPRGTPTGGNHHGWVHRLSPSPHLEEGKRGTPPSATALGSGIKTASGANAIGTARSRALQHVENERKSPCRGARAEGIGPHGPVARVADRHCSAAGGGSKAQPQSLPRLHRRPVGGRVAGGGWDTPAGPTAAVAAMVVAVRRLGYASSSEAR